MESRDRFVDIPVQKNIPFKKNENVEDKKPLETTTKKSALSDVGLI